MHRTKWFVRGISLTVLLMLLATVTLFASFTEATCIIRLRLKCDCTRAEDRFRLSAKRTIPFKSAGASVQSTTGSRGVRNSGSNVVCILLGISPASEV